VQLTFSGSFDADRINKEQAKSTRDRLLRIVLWAVAITGIVAIILSGLTNFSAAHPWFMVHRDLFNVFFWISVVGDLYLWAFVQNQKLEYGVALAQRTAAGGSSAPIDVYDLYSHSAKDAWNKAWAVAQKRNAPTVTVEDELLALCGTQDIQLALFRLGINTREFMEVIASAPTPTDIGHLPFVAYQKMVELHNNLVDPVMLLCGAVSLLPTDHPVQQYFFQLGISEEILEVVAIWIFNLRLVREEDLAFQHLAKFKPSGGTNKGLTAVPTHYLDQFSQDLTIQAKFHQLPISLGREPDLDNVFKILGENNSNLLIKGDEGTGRTTLVNMLAHHMVMEDVPPLLQDKRLVRLETSALVGAKLPAEQVLMQALGEAEASGNIVLVIEDIDSLARASGAQGLSLLEILVNRLQQSSLTVIGTTTPDNYLNYIHQQPNFDQIFVSYELQDLTPQAIMAACCIRASIIESQTGVIFLFNAIQAAITLSDRYFKDAGQPQKAIGLLQEAASKVKGTADKVVTAETIQKIIGEKTHIPEETITASEGEKLLGLEDEMGKYIIGQKEAVKAVAESLRRARSGLSSGDRPLASFMFVGPTGVGKTELAKTLTKIYFGDERYLLRLDMSEYQGDMGLTKLLGMPNSETNTPFVNHLKNYPFCLFLLDEFEKASHDVLNLFLQILEDGRLTTSAGQTLDLTQTIIIATSNAGTREIQDGLKSGETLDQIKGRLVDEILLNHFAPELLNRFDGVILFTPLSPNEVEQIAGLQIQGLVKNLLDKGYKVSFGQALISDIAQKAYDPSLGARPIRRYIQDHVEGVIAKLILGQQLKRGSTATVDLENGEIVVR
jgi:ATP-dependent Clp protease ATP-binding subunit ClpA